MQSLIPTLKPQTLKSWRIITPILALLLVLAVACGEAAAPTSPPPAAQATEAPQAAAQATEALQAATQPTAVPEAMAEPEEAMVEVNPGKLTIMVGDLGNERFDLILSGGTGPRNYGRIIGGFLMSDNEQREMLPGIASKWALSADGLTWTFTIRKGVKFNDGSELTPDDVLWTFQHYWGPGAIEYNSADQSITRNMVGIELSGPAEVSLTTGIPITHLGNVLSEAGPKWYQVLPKRTMVGDTAEAEAYDKKPIGAGIMRLEKHVRASVMSFERFDDYYYQPKNGFPEDKRVNFQSLDLFLVPEEATRVAALRTGEADIVPGGLDMKGQVEKAGGGLVFSPEAFLVRVRLYGCLNDPENPLPCDDKRVRQALAYAVDKELIRDRLYGGPEAFQVKGWASVTPSTIGYTPELDPYPFDPDKARQLLADAGYKTPTNPGGKDFGKLFVNTFHGNTPHMVESAQLGAEFWKRELGLDVEVRVGDKTGIRKQQYAGELNGQVEWSDFGPRRDASSSIASTYGEPKDFRRYHDDPDLFRLVQETLQILDPDKRAKAKEKMWLGLREESYGIAIGYFNLPWAVGPRVLTWQPFPMSLWPSALHTITLE